MAQPRRNNAFPVQACFVVRFQDDAEQTEGNNATSHEFCKFY